MSKFKERLVNLIFPALIFGAITGLLTAFVVILYKFIAKHVIDFSQEAYGFLRNNLYFIPLILVAFFFLAILFSKIYKKQPRVSGGGIPSAIALLRGIVTFKWLRTLIGVFFMSLTSFLIGVPLGNEGPSVLMGTAVGKGSVSLLAKKYPVWSKYSMTGGACAGFAVATGAPVSGLLFAIEEAHQRISPMILIVSSVAVLVAQIVSETFCPLLGLSTSLFPEVSIINLAIKDIWVPLLVGVATGLFAVLFLKYYNIISKFFSEKLKKVPHHIKIFAVYTLTLVFGLISFSFISTGHESFYLFIERKEAVYGLIILLFVRMTLTLFANTNKLTGGVFVPILALGIILSSVLGGGLEWLGLSSEYYTAILVLGVASCISAMMKMPLTAIVFSLEVFGVSSNVLYIIVAVAVSFIITELLGAKGINDSILKNIVKAQEKTLERKVIDTHITIQKGSFAEHMHEKDVLWPANFFVLSIIPSKTRYAQIDKQGEKTFHAGDVLHIRYATFDDVQTKAEITAIVGEQDYEENETLSEQV